MSPELITAVKQRIVAGQSKDVIKAEVLAMGYSEAIFESVFTLAQHDLEKGIEAPVVSGNLPSAFDLLERSLAFVWKRLDVVAFILVPALLFFFCTYAGERMTEPKSLAYAIDGVTAVFFIIYIVALFAVMYITSSHEQVPTYKESLEWTKTHLLPLLFVSLLVFLVVVAGFVLFIIPGLVLGITLYFAQYALIIEDERGMNALTRSRTLVKGRFWEIALKLFALIVYIWAPIFVAMVVVVMVAETQPALQKFALAGEVALEVVSAFTMVVVLHAMGQLYRALQVGRPLPAERASGGVYWFLAVLGVVAAVGLVLAIVFFKSSFTESVVVDSTALQSEIQSSGMSAKLYAREHQGSFEGVCDVLKTRVTSAESVECNDTDTAWAISGLVGETRWCADTTTVGKQVKTELKDRLTCFPLPEKAVVEEKGEEDTTTSGTLETPEMSQE
ncbi:MAG: hypothetical protein RLZZ480_774 [Candidatus Parcubacteria bacterium]|jgi:hypothetical protein